MTLTGGPATGLAFAPLFEAAGVPGAATVAIAAAMVGIISGGLIGGPVRAGVLPPMIHPAAQFSDERARESAC